MRIQDVNTTDIYADRTGRPIRIVQVGPRAGGRYWSSNGWKNGFAQFQTTNRDNQSVFHAHLAVAATNSADRPALSVLPIPEWTGDDAQDTRSVMLWNEQLETDEDCEFYLAIVNTRNLKLWTDYASQKAAKREQMVQDQADYQERLSVVEAFKPILMDMLVDAGVDRDEIPTQPSDIGVYLEQERARVYLPLAWLRVINQSTPPH